jgi:hypothetical protein
VIAGDTGLGGTMGQLRGDTRLADTRLAHD